MQCVEIMSLAQKHENDVYLQATTANSFVKLVPIFYPRKGFSQVTRALQRCFIWAPPPLPGLPLIVNFDGQRLSPSLEQSLNCVYLCVYCVLRVLVNLCTCEHSPLSSNLSTRRETHFFFGKLNSPRLPFEPAAAKPLKWGGIESSNLFVSKRKEPKRVKQLSKTRL